MSRLTETTAAVLAALPGTALDIIKKSGCSNTAVREWLRRLSANGEIHISDWEKSARGNYMPVYTKGFGSNVPCVQSARAEAEDRRRRPANGATKAALAAARKAELDAQWQAEVAAHRAQFHSSLAAKSPAHWASTLFFGAGVAA